MASIRSRIFALLPQPGGAARCAAAFSLALALGGCLSVGDVTGSLRGSSSSASLAAPLPSRDAELRQYADDWGRKFEANPTDRIAALNYARALRALTRYDEEVAVTREAAIKSPHDLALLGAYGKALADVGRYDEAARVLAQADTPERPDWSILRAQGMVADQMGNYDDAQKYYAQALKINPGEPTVMSNLGLSYALQKRLPEAETVLRQAAGDARADKRVRQNLALVLALQGKFDEAEQISRRDLSPSDATANVAAIRDMIAQSNTWRQIQKLDPKAPRPPLGTAQASAQVDAPAN
jgi:Flp pilus assembly protein TadD